MGDLTKLVEEHWKSQVRSQSDLHLLLTDLTKQSDFAINCITDLRAEIEANREEIKELKQSKCFALTDMEIKNIANPKLEE